MQFTSVVTIHFCFFLDFAWSRSAVLNSQTFHVKDVKYLGRFRSYAHDINLFCYLEQTL